MDQQRKGQIGIAQRVGGAQLRPAVFALRGGDADQLGAVLAGPGDVAGRLAAAEAVIGGVHRVEECRQLRDMGQDARDDVGHHVAAAGAPGGDVDMHAVAGLAVQRQAFAGNAAQHAQVLNACIFRAETKGAGCGRDRVFQLNTAKVHS